MLLRVNDRPIEFLDGISAVAGRYDAFISDIWGVLHDGVRLYPGVRDCLTHLKQYNKKVLLLSNSARLADEIRDQIAALGLKKDLYDHILSSGELTRDVFLSGSDTRIAGLGRRYVLLGPDTYRVAHGLGFQRTDDPGRANFVFAVGISGNPSSPSAYEPLLIDAAARKLPMVCANPDIHVVRDGVMGIGSGALASFYERLGGEVIYFGKPHRAIYERCLQILGIETGRVAAVGDGIKTDIAGAAAFGIDSILVASGIHGAELAGIPDDCTGLAALLAAEPHSPTMAAKGFYW